MHRGAVAVSGPAGLPAAHVRRIARGVLAREGQTVDLSVTFLGLAAMRRMNHQYKRHDRPTDVLAFALPQPEGRLAGDIYVCPGVAVREARVRGVTRAEELARLIIHGILHVLGHDHPDGAGREHSPMWARQEALVAELT
jgi:probable rRNA maturation factor